MVIARAKKGTIASVIFGVAIATALMPPLCTVGFGLAIGNLGYAFGAMYLFIINTIFIALATFLTIKLLKFPMVRYANSAKRRRIARIASVVAILVMVPAGYTFYKVFQESIFKKQATEFVNATIAQYQFTSGGRFLSNFTTIEYNEGENPLIEVVCMGNESIPPNIIATWNTMLKENDDYPRLRNTELHVIQGGQNEQADQLKYINELYESQKNQISSKDERIAFLEAEVNRLRRNESRQIPFVDITSEAKANYENLMSLQYGKALKSNFSKVDTLTIFEPTWKDGLSPTKKMEENKKMLQWLKVRLKDTTIVLRSN